MHYKLTDINYAFELFVNRFTNGQHPFNERTESRVGSVITCTEPIIVSYSNPTSRVLLYPERDANPFFHLFEAVWMLAGSNRLAPLLWYNKRMVEFSDDKEVLTGSAYGYRWTKHFQHDQLTSLIMHLTEKPNTRRAVLAMWDPFLDMHNVDNSLDVPCNTHIYFRRDSQNRLEMTVCNRSNDLIWGMLGSNYVTFSVLQEAVAGICGLKPGCYHHMTNNLHVYTERFRGTEWLDNQLRINEEESKEIVPLFADHAYTCVESRMSFLDECEEIVKTSPPNLEKLVLHNPWLRSVVLPMCVSHYHYKIRNFKLSMIWINRVIDPLWRAAGKEWLYRRLNKYVQKNLISGPDSPDPYGLIQPVEPME